MLQLGVDEITLVLQISQSLKQSHIANDDYFEWRNVAERIIAAFLYQSDFLNIFGESHTEFRPPQGYTNAYKYGEHNFYLAIAYHELMMNMGVVVKFSAQAFDYYCEKTGKKVYNFLQSIQSFAYTARLSRIDLTADFINEGIDVTSIYNDLMHNRVGLFRQSVNKKTGEIEYKRQLMKYEGYLRNR